MTRDSMKGFAKACLNLAGEYVKDARLSLTHLRLRTALNCAYYAMFHAARAVLASRGITPPRTHKGLREVFGKEVILKGLADRELGRIFSRAFELRQAGSYEVYAKFGEEEVKEIVEKAEKFVEKMKELVKNLNVLWS